MLELREFNYKNQKDGKVAKREVIVTEENSTHLAGWDVSKLEKEEQKEIWRNLVKDIDMSKLTEEEQAAEYNKFKSAQLQFRKFIKRNIC